MSARYEQDRCAHAPLTVRPFQIRGRFLTALALRIENKATDAGFFEALDDHLRATPQFFADAPLVIDLAKEPSLADPKQLRDLVDSLRRRKLLVFGIQNAGLLKADVLQSLGLIPIHNGRDAPAPNEKSGRASRIEKLLPPDNRTVVAPVRSGQMVVAERGDLTIVGSVASGAEVIAGGNIHVYGTLRGRAMAGVHGDDTARIFCRSLDAELVAIAGLYQTSQTLEAAATDRCMQIFLKDERLHMEALA